MLEATLNSAIQNAHKGVMENVLGTQEHADAAQELNMFAQREIDRVKAHDQNDLDKQKLEAEKEAAKIRADLDKQKLEADKFKAARDADIAREKIRKDTEIAKQRLEAEKEKAERDAEIEREKIKAEKEKAEKEAEVEKEKIKAERARSTKDTVVRVLQLGGVVIVSGLMLITDSDNWMGRGCRVGSSFIQKFLKL